VSSLLGKLRVAMFMPPASETDRTGKPGWQPAGAEQREQLQRVANLFMAGLKVGLEGGSNDVMAGKLGQIEQQYQGFAYEGCGMGLAVADSLSARPRRVREFLAGPGADHLYMIYVGIGWGMARIPRMRWRAVIPADPLLRWLTLDGLGFHQAFFHTDKYVTNQWRPQRYPAWPGDTDYVHRAIDHGIGRALWFVNGANPRAVAACIGRYPADRQGDLWSGIGLASTYAGGVDAGELATLRELAGRYRPELAQGSVFAGKTRLMTGLVTAHTELAVKNHCEMSVEEAAAVADNAAVDLPPDGRVPGWEIWRQRIQVRFR
jgi:enediyne biosynthesis protein E3